ncbi:MAG: Pls/PosA family non-ribosomal peptide synthetase, partial [Acidimicrobiales bacterium]
DVGDRADTRTETTRDLNGGVRLRAAGQTEDELVEALTRLLEVEDVPQDGNLFDDLGADSLVVAALCAHLRNNSDLPVLSIREVYEHPTVAELAEHLDIRRAGAEPAPREPVLGDATDAENTVSSGQYWFCGFLQLSTLLAVGLGLGLLVEASYNLIAPASGVGATYVRSILVGAGLFGILVAVPIAAKWIIIGRWKTKRIRLWSLGYFRFWLGRIAAASNPLRVFVGSPIYVFYLRAMGANVGPGAVILSRRVPVCADLLTVGAGAVVREDASLSCYRADGQYLELGPVEIGESAVVGHSSVLDIWTRVGNSSQLGHMSALSPGQSVPDGAHMVGTSATTSSGFDYADFPHLSRSGPRRVAYALLQLSVLFLVVTPLIISLGVAFLEWRANAADLSIVTVVLAALVLFVAILLARFLLAVTAGRFLGRFVGADIAYPLYGVRYAIHRVVRRLTNVVFLGRLVGDSSYVLNYYQAIGYDVSFEEQTGANFGNRVRHDNPRLISVGPGTMAADDLVMVNADYSASSFRLGQVEIGARSFFGNTIIYPSQAKTTENCLLASKVMVPLEGPERTDVGFLGSPSFEIPRMVFRDREFEALRRSDDFPRLLADKNKHNLGSMAWFLLARFVGLLGLVAIAFGVGEVLDRLGPFGVFAGILAAAVVAPAYRVFVDRASIRFGRLQPTHCSIYDLDLWQVERYWKLSWEPKVLNATPFKPFFWRMLGVRVGRRMFDDGCSISEKTMLTIGDDCSFNAHSHIQSHSLEDGSYKSDFIEIGSGCTLGVGGLVHYGAVMEDGSSLEANAFLMKGTVAPVGTTWGENPARELEVAPRASVEEGQVGVSEPAA